MVSFAIQKLLYCRYRKAMDKMFGCMFCRVAEGQERAKVVYEDDRALAFEDVHPKAPVHLLVIPKKHVVSLNDLLPEDEPLFGHLLSIAAHVAREKGIAGSGYRTVINTNAEAGQSVFHVHVHVLGGRVLRWPPG